MKLYAFNFLQYCIIYRSQKHRETERETCFNLSPTPAPSSPIGLRLTNHCNNLFIIRFLSSSKWGQILTINVTFKPSFKNGSIFLIYYNYINFPSSIFEYSLRKSLKSTLECKLVGWLVGAKLFVVQMLAFPPFHFSYSPTKREMTWES